MAPTRCCTYVFSGKLAPQKIDSRESFQTFPEYAILARATTSSTVHSHVVSFPQSGQNSTLCAKQAIQNTTLCRNELNQNSTLCRNKLK